MTQATITPLRRFMRALDAEQKRIFAQECGTTLLYLHQLAANPKPNPTLRMVMAIVERSRVWGQRVMAPGLAIEDLLIGQASDEPDDDGPVAQPRAHGRRGT